MPGKGITIWISEKCHLSLSEYEIINGFELEIISEINFNSSEICVAIFNYNDRLVTYEIEVVTENKLNDDNDNDDDDNKEDDKLNFILIICIAVFATILIILIIIIIIIICVKRKMCKCCRKGENYEKSYLNSDLAVSITE